MLALVCIKAEGAPYMLIKVYTHYRIPIKETNYQRAHNSVGGGVIKTDRYPFKVSLFNLNRKTEIRLEC